MPYTPTTPTLDLCNDLVSYLTDATDVKPPDTVRRAYLHKIPVSVSDSGDTGRHVVFFPTAYDNRPAARGRDFYTHKVTVVIYRFYRDQADQDVVVPQEWVDREVDFVHDEIIQGLEFFRDGVQPTFNKFLVTLSSDVEAIYDSDELAERKLFLCAVQFVFQEERSA